MQKIKRFFSILLALSLGAGMLAMPVAVSAEPGENDFLIADFTQSGVAAAFGFTEDTQTYYEDGGRSARWATSGSLNNKNSGIYYLSGSSEQTVDLTGMTALHMLMYNEEDVGNQMNILLNTPPGYFNTQIDLDWTGWKEIVIPLSDFGKKNTTPASTWDAVSSIRFNYAGWNAAFLAHSPVYFDSIWMEAKPVPASIEIANAETLPEAASPASAFSENTDYSRLYAHTAKWDGSAFDIIFDASAYYLPNQEFLYHWIYSPKATGEEIEVRLVNASDSTYVADTFTVDWEGWKLVGLYTSDFSGSGTLKNANTYRVMGANSELYFDRIWFSNKVHPTVTASSLFATGGKLPSKNAQIRLQLSAGFTTSAKNAVKLTKNGEAFSEFEAGRSGTQITISIPSLERGATYTLALADGLKSSSGSEFCDFAPIAFSAYASGSTADTITFIDGNGSAITDVKGAAQISATADTAAENGDTLTLIAAAYGGDAVIAVASASGTGRLTTPVLDVSAQTAVKAWVVSEKNGVIRRVTLPETDADLLYTPASNTAQQFSLDSVYQESGGFVLDMHYSGPKRLAAAVVSDSGGNIVIADEFYINSDMQYLLNTQNVAVEQGTYKVCVSLIGENTVYTADTYFLNEEEEAEILSAVNDAAQYTDILQLMKTYSILFRVNTITDEALLAHIAVVLFEEKTYESFDNVHETVNLARAALEELNSTDWSELDAYFSNYDIALGTSEAAEAYYSFSEDERRSFCKEIVTHAPFSSFMELRAVVSDVIDTYKETGTVGSTVKPSVSGNADAEDKEYWVEHREDIPLETVTSFIDLEGYSWAAESIYSLLERNIIEMPADREFRPAAAITRAEFVKLLVMAVGLDTSEQTSVFTDVNAGDWYTPYLTAAKKAGIISGYPDGTAGPNEIINRQDMAVMVQGALDALGMEFAVVNENCQITDIDDVDPYARDAVRMVMECGIMQGTGGDAFAPKTVADRAAAAVVIAQLVKGMQAGGLLDMDTPAVASDISEMPEYILLNAIGVIAADDSIHASSAVTRRELARAMYKIVSAGGAETAGGDVAFEDVKSTDPDYTAISMMVSLGYMTAPEGTFRPDEPIDMYEFARAAIYALGYDYIAERTGGYPVGYMNIASKLNLTKNGYLDSVQTINNEEFINLLYNVLSAVPARFSGVSDSSFIGYTVNDDNTLLYEKFSIYRLRGLLEADMYSDILVKSPRPAAGHVIISGDTYATELNSVNALVGHMTEAYVHEERDEVVAIFSYKTEETVFSGRDIVIEDTAIRYLEDGQDTYKRVKFSKNVSLLYNGRQTPYDESLFDSVNGNITTIDYDGDHVADAIKIYNYSTLQVRNVSVESGIITDSLGGKSIMLGGLEAGTEYLLYKNGAQATLQDLAVDDIISYTETDSLPNLITMYACDSVVEGAAERITSDEAVINGERYYIIPAAANRILLGADVKFHLDFMGQIAAASTALDMVYGYLYRIYEDVATADVYMKLFTENNRWVELKLADQVRLNARKKDAQEVLEYFGTEPDSYRQLIRYNVSEDAQIVKLYTAEEYKAWTDEEAKAMATDQFRLSHSESNAQYYSANYCFGTHMVVSDETKIFLVPPVGSTAGIEDYLIINASALVNNRRYAEVASYNADETFVADAMVIRDNIDNVYAIANQSSVAPVMIVTEVGVNLNNLGNACYKITGGYNGSAKVSFNTRELALPGTEVLKQGDIVQLGIDRDGYIINIEKLYNAENGFRQYIVPGSAYASSSFMSGEVKSVDAVSGRIVVQCDTTDKGTAAVLNASAKLYVYDTESNEVTIAARDDILAGDMVFVGARYLSIQQMVIFR